MDELLIQQIKNVPVSSLEEMERDLLRILASQTGGRLAVAEARARLHAVLRRACGGMPLIIGKREDPVAIMSLRDLAALLQIMGNRSDSDSEVIE